MDQREAVNRAAREHVRRTEARLAAGREEIDRQNTGVSDTREHIEEMRRWIEQGDEARRDD